MGIGTIIKRLFSDESDPLDELLIEKGVNPGMLIRNIHLERNEEGDESPVYRALYRYEEKRACARKIVRQAKNG